MMRFVLPLPPSVNEMYDRFIDKKTGKVRTVKSVRYKEWRAEAEPMIMAQRVGRRMPDPPYALDIWLFFPKDGHRRDADNFVKALQDGLARILHFDDNLVTDPSPHKRFIVGRAPYCIVFLEHSSGGFREGAI